MERDELFEITMKKAIENLLKDLFGGDNAEKEIAINDEITNAINEVIRNFRYLYQSILKENVPYDVKKQALKMLTTISVELEKIIINCEETFE